MTEEITGVKIGTDWSFYATRNEHVPFTGSLYRSDVMTWVRICDEKSARRGSIGIAVPKGYDPVDRSAWPPRAKPKYSYFQNDLDNSIDIYLGENKVLKNYSFHKRGIEWLKDYQGPATWVFNKNTDQKPKYTFTDAMGDVIELGDFGVYADSNGKIHFGTVTKISKVGMIYVTNIKTPSVPYRSEFRLKAGNQFSKMTKDIFQRLMLLKLAD